MKRTVALIFGGEGVEHQISEASARNIASLIDTDTYDLLLVGITRCGEWYIYNGTRDKIENGAWQKDKKQLAATAVRTQKKRESGKLTEKQAEVEDWFEQRLKQSFGE